LLMLLEVTSAERLPRCWWDRFGAWHRTGSLFAWESTATTILYSHHV